MKTLIPIIFCLLVFIPYNYAKKKEKEAKTDKTSKEEPLRFVGCFKDSDPRDLPQRVHEHGGSVRDCIKTCKDMKFRFAGIQFAYLCFCGNLHGRFGQLPNGRCDSDCKHANDTQCGGEWANSVYKTGYVPPRLRPKTRAKKHDKRDNVVMFDEPKQYNTEDSRAFSIDVDPVKYSSIPESDIEKTRSQRSYSSDYLNSYNSNQPNTLSYYGSSNRYPSNNGVYNQYGSDAGIKQYSSGNKQYGSSQYGYNTQANARQEISSNNSTSAGYSGYPQQSNDAQQYQSPQQTNQTQSDYSNTPSGTGSYNSTAQGYGTATGGQGNGYQAAGGYSNDQYGTKATSNYPGGETTSSQGNTVNYNQQQNYTQGNGQSTQQSYGSTTNTGNDANNAYRISISFHDDNTTAGTGNTQPSSQSQPSQTDSYKQYSSSNSGYPSYSNAAQDSTSQQANNSSYSSSSYNDANSGQQSTASYAQSSASSQDQSYSAPAAAAATPSQQQYDSTASSAAAPTPAPYQAQAEAPSYSASATSAAQGQQQYDNTASSAPAPAPASAPYQTAESSSTSASAASAAQGQQQYDNTASSAPAPAPYQAAEGSSTSASATSAAQGKQQYGNTASSAPAPAPAPAPYQTQAEASSTLASATSAAQGQQQYDNTASSAPAPAPAPAPYQAAEGSSTSASATSSAQEQQQYDNTASSAPAPAPAPAPYQTQAEGSSTSASATSAAQGQQQYDNTASSAPAPAAAPYQAQNEASSTPTAQSQASQSASAAPAAPSQSDATASQAQAPAQAASPPQAPAAAPAPAAYSSSPYQASPAPAPAPAVSSPAPAPAPYASPPQSYNNYPSYAPAQSSQPATTSTNEKPKTPCQIERKMAGQMEDTFTPKCKDNGDYEDVQCFEHKGYGKQCWCVNEKGHEKKGTRAYGDEVPSCVSQAHQETQCERERKIASSANVPDIYVPTCNSLGDFEPMQCFEHSTYGKQCWCVDGSGQQIKGTKTFGAPTPDCGNTQAAVAEPVTCKTTPYGCCSDGVSSAKGPNQEGCTTTVPGKPSKCQQEQIQAKNGPMDMFIPECKPNGEYNEVQCYTFPVTEKTECWCVDKDSGVERPGTRLNEKQPDCQAPVLPTKTRPYAFTICLVSVFKCCPDGVTPAKGPDNEGCPGQPTTTVAPAPTTAKPTVPLGGPNEVCVTLKFKQVWYPQLKDRFGLYYIQLQKDVEGSLKQIYKVHPDFNKVHFSEARPEQNPHHPSGPKALAVFFVLFFRNLVADPLATLRDSIDKSNKLAGRSVFPESLRNLGIPYHHLGCPPANYKPILPVTSRPGTTATSKPVTVVTTSAPSTTQNPCGPCLTPPNCPTICPPQESTTPSVTQPPQTTTPPPLPPQTTTPPPLPPQTTTPPPPSTAAPGTTSPCGPCISPSTCPPPCPQTLPPQTTPPPTLPPQTTPPPTLPPQTTPPPTLPPQTTTPPTLPPQTTTPPTLPPQTTTPPAVTCGPCVTPPNCPPPCPVPCPAPCPTTPPPTTAPPTTPTTPSTPTTSTTQAPTTKTTPSTEAPPTTPSTPIPATTPLPPVDGNYTGWTEWTECSATCGGGVQQRTRTCTNPAPKNGGKNCDALGSSFETKECNSKPCPEDGGYSNWGEFQECTRTCGGGLQYRTRTCDNPKPLYGGKNCTRLGPANETRACNTFYCPINGNFSDWSEFMTCSVTCGGGVQYKTRMCTNPPPQHGGKNCSELGPSRISRECNEQKCPVDGGYSPFSNFSDCTVTCGGGTQIRTRTCTNPPPRYGGDDCSKDGPDFETRKCNTQLCPIDGAFTSYSNYSTCSKTCGGGVQVRLRSCTNPEPQFGGKNCTGTYKETRACNSQPCPIDGGFSEWGNYSRCEVTCGGGTQMRMRTCTNPAPGNGGRPCSGSTTETRDCNIQPCPVNGGYNEWSKFGPCSSSCGGGTQQRTRECTNPPPAQGGKSCAILGPSHQTRNCSTNPCPISGGYTGWTDWSECSKTCGGGFIKRTRNCSSPEPQYGGKDCSILGAEQETQSCNTMPCPINGNYSAWAEWSSCTVTCGGGEHMRSRTCTNPPPEYGGKDCTSLGKSTETAKCNTQSCPVNGGYSEWTSWSDCTVTCGEGQQYRTRNCSKPTPDFGGSDCSSLGNPTDTKACVKAPCPEEPSNMGPEVGWSQCSKSCGVGVQWRSVKSKDGKTENETRTCAPNPCPVDGGYSKWSNWTACSVSCGGGVTSRSRTCTEPIPMFGGQRCEEPDGPVQTKQCNMQECPAPRIPIRSCREFYERCHKRQDGLYNIYINEKVTAREIIVYCDMTHSQGGWTLLVTSATNDGWTADNIKMRNPDEPSLRKDYSILGEADDIKAIAIGPFQYRLEANERLVYGGIWSAPQTYSFTSTSGNLTGVTEVEKFPPSWNYGPTSLGNRMPWLPQDDDYAYLTTSDRVGKEWYGTIVAKKPEFKPAPWIMGTIDNPGLIWYWIKEAPSMLKPPSESQPDPMCPSPVAGGYNEWSDWTPCPKSCGGGMQLRTRNCTNPQPLNGGADCSARGGDIETRECNTLPCPGQTVNGRYSPWSDWSECTATCGGGTQMRTRKCDNPAPQNGGKTCIDQGLGNELETRQCNTRPCPSPCSPPCQNSGQCVNNHCKCPPGLYEGTYCQTAICKKPCQNGGTCVDPKANTCSCPPSWRGQYCEKPICVKYCMNGGTCSGPNTCTCMPDYFGKRCENSTCQTNCVNGGKCVNKVCQCPSGYSGLACENVQRCALPKPDGPCYSALKEEVQKADPADFNTPCMTFLREVYQSCSSRSLPELTRELCEKQCDSGPDICGKIWMPLQCKSAETRFYFDKASSKCKNIQYNGCLGNQNLFATSTSCQKNCASGGNYGPTVVTPTIPRNAPPVPTSYYWYFLAVTGKQITGSPPLLTSGTYKLIDLGYYFNSRQSWAQTRITRQDCLLNPEACLLGLSIGFKIKLDKSMASCQEPRYLLDTGATSLMTRGVSVFVVGETLSVQITTSKNVYKAVTQVTLGRWFYLMITWRPSAGLSVYINENKKSSTVNPLPANNPPISDQNPNFAVGKGLGSAGGTCGMFYMSSLAIFKQYVDANMVKRIYRFFWVNIVSPSPPTTYYIYMRVTNRVGQRIIVRSGDDMPAEGFPISANVIAEITKTVPGNIQTTFTVYNMETGKQMAINQSEITTITPTPTKQYPYHIIVGKPVVGKKYFIFMRITNMAKRDVRVLTGDGKPAEGFTIKPNLIADITKQVSSPFAVNMSVVDTTGKPLFINYKPYLFLTPTETKGNAIPITITLTASPVRHYYIQLAFKNYAGGDVIVQPSDGEPEGGFHVKKNTMMKITKTVGSKNPITLTAIDAQSRVAVAINNAPSFIVTPKNDKGAFTEVTIKKQIVKPNPTGVYAINLVVTNNAGRDVSLIPSDNKPDDGFEIPTGTMVIVSKTTNGTTPVDFIAVDIETETLMFINGEEKKRITPSTNESRIQMSITAPAGSQQKPKIPSVTPAFYWSFYTVNNGTVPGSPSFTARGDFQIVDGGLFLDGTSAYLTAHLNSDDALVYPERFSRGFAFGLKVKFPDTVKGYTVPKYVLDSGVKSLSSRGVSLYILEQKLVVELATSDTKWKAETDIVTNKWIYVLVSWSMQRGLSLFVDGQEMSGDSGGMGVSNYLAAPQEENLSIGRNIGDSAPNFASFYISSFAVFREELSAPLAFDIYKYYVTDAIIQPSKMYFINFHVTNTLDKEIELLSSDGQPAGGFHIKPKQVVIIRKELSTPTSVTFTAQDVSTAGDVIINGELEYIATPSEYKQQMTAVTITPVGSSGKPAPRDRFYVTLNLKNKYRANAMIISSDNHPSDGYRLSPMSYETLTKEVFTDKKIIIHAYDPATNKGLLINGESSYSVMPTRERGNPDALEITSSEKGELVVNPPVPYSYYWSLSSINKGFVEGNPAFKVNGGVTTEDGGLAFDGKTGWLGAHVDQLDCLVDPERCTKGFAIGTKINIDPSSLSSKEEKYILDTGAQSTAKRGVSLYTMNGKLVFVLATTDKTWEASASVTGGKWIYLLVTWNRNEGVKMYVDNQMKSSARDGKPNPDKRTTTEQINLSIGRNINGISAPMNGMFKMASLAVFNTYIQTQMIAPVSNYFSKPLATRPSSKYYIVLQITNPTTNSLILKPSDNYPNQGFPIKAKVIAKIKKEVSTPAQVSFEARAAGSNKVLFLDGKSRIDITPSGSPLEVHKISVSEQGQTVKPLPEGGVTEETGVTAPPVRPDHSWLLANLDGNTVPGDPALTATGKISRIDGGLSFDGSTAFLSATLDNKDCMLNPDLCSEGFSFGIKLKFTTDSLTVNAPRYVVDSGRTGKARGIAVYLVMKELFVEIATSNALYKGAVTVTGDTWFYLTATWSRRAGLTVYMDDKPTSTVPSGMSGLRYPINAKTPNFVIGRSATAALYYSKVNIGSFSTYKQLLSSDAVKANYRFFWTRGSGGEGKTFYAVLEVTNPLQTDAVILTDDGVPNEGFRIPKATKVKIAKTLKSGVFITFRATDPKGLVTYYLDNVDAIKVQATHSKDVVTRATLSLTGVDTESGVNIATTKYSKAPPVLASHSWSMNAISLKAKKVPGMPPLSAVGSFDLGGGGLLFDGKSTSLGGTISKEDCLIDPGLCMSGFGLGSKLFLDSGVSSYTQPKYIVDTGASSAKTRGISMYVMSGKVFFELATSSKVWTVSTSVEVNTWLFISITWFNDNGLLLYLNGVKKVEDKTGRLESGRAVNLHDKNLCVGRDAKDGGVDYAKFMMASLLTFNSYLSPSVMRATYTFYWRNAGAGLAPVGFVALKLVNKAGVDAMIDTSDKKPGHGLPLPTGYLMTYHKQIAAGSSITIKATETATKSPLLLNNQPSVSVTETLTDRVPFSIVVSKTKIGGATGTSTQIFYVSIKILNKSGKEVVLKASDSKAFEDRIVKKGFQTTITKSVKGNAPITFTVVDATQTSFVINGKKEVTVTPTAQKGTPITFEVTNGNKPAGKQYYIALKVINRSGKNVQLTSSSGNWLVKKNVMMNILKGITSNSPVEIKAVEKEDQKPVTINNNSSISITPKPTKERVELTIRSSAVGSKKQNIPSKVNKPSVYYVTLKVFNKAGKKSMIAPSFKDISQGLHIGSGPVMQITKEYTADHPLRLQAFDPLTGKALLMNNRQHLIIRPGGFDDPATKITLTNPTGTEIPEVKEHYITILANNRLNREARILPSRGKRGGYIVPARSLMKILIIIKGGPPDPRAITFKVEDVETESTLEINEKITAINVTPTELSDVVTHFNITAPAPSVKPQHSWSTLALNANKIFGSPPLHAHGFYRFVDDGVAFDGTDTYMTAVLPKYDSLVNPDNSKTGFTVATKIRFDSEAMEYQDKPRFILDTGGHHKGKRGMSLYIDSGKLYVEVETLDRIWTVSKPLSPRVWMYLTITWNKKDGLKLYRDSVLRADDDVGRPSDNSKVIDLEENLTIGRSVSSNGEIRYAKFDMGSLTTFGQALNQSDINKAFIFFSNSLSAKIFYAPIRITNEAGRDIIVKPNKGNAHGFNMIPRSTLEVTLMSMSTDGNPTSPVVFTAIDTATKTPLEINNSPNAFPVTPRESMTDFTTMVVSAPQPSVVPKAMWTLQKVEHGKVVGSSPTVQAHGQLKQLDDGLELDGKDSWLDAGDFKGTCLSDPQRCPAGMTVGFKVKFDDDSLAYTHEPHYVLDTGGSNSNGRGFTVFVKNKKLYAVVSQSNSAWRVEAPYTTNKWQYGLVTWKQEDGLTLYMDGAPVASSEAVVPQQGDHMQDSFTHLAVGRNTAGPPYGNTKMAVSSIVFFDQHVRPLDAKKISLYYWGSVSQSSSDRFIKVKFFNRAGVPIKILPSKGDNKDQGYTIQPHMNLQLSYMEKGPFNNVPVTFLALNPATDERLFINGRSGVLRAMPTPSKLAVTEAVISSSFSCPQPNGFFSDPTSNARYIHCTDKNPNIMMCPDKMTWHSDISSCAGEGRESSDLYYYNVRFNNYAGNEAEILKTTGHKQRNMLPPGKSLHVKFTTTKKHPTVFRAIYADTGETLRLNDYPLLQIYPSDNPEKVTEVNVNKPAFFYTVITKTGNQEDADTQANVFIKLIGEDGSTPELPLAHKGVTHFKLGGQDKFRIEATNIGKLQKVFLRHDDSGESPNWFLDKVLVRDMKGRPYQFNVNSWLDSKQGDHVTTKLLDVQNPMAGNDECVPSCLNNATCIDGKCQCGLGYEGDQCQDAVCDVPCLNGGTCISPDSNKCACPEGYTGNYCDQPVCSDYCRNGGTCSGPNQCTCPTGFVGTKCEISSCIPKCMNGGQCVDGACQCPLGHSGKYCEQVSICDLASDPGPCFHELFRAASQFARSNRTTGCKSYLTNVLQSCTANNGSYNMEECRRICEPEGEQDVCKKIWQPGKCTSLLTKYTYNKDTGVCRPMLYNGCLGNSNSFDSLEECNNTCGIQRKRRTIINSTREQKPNLLRNLLPKRLHHVRRHASYK